MWLGVQAADDDAEDTFNPGPPTRVLNLEKPVLQVSGHVHAPVHCLLEHVSA